MAPCVVLVGVPGSGKSTVGALLSERLHVVFRDTDRDIEVAEGKTVSDIFVDDGEAAFRSLERAAVADALAAETGVVSLGGGAPLDPATALLLAGHVVVFLDVGIADAARRIGFDRSRPLLSVRADRSLLRPASNEVVGAGAGAARAASLSRSSAGKDWYASHWACRSRGDTSLAC